MESSTKLDTPFEPEKEEGTSFELLPSGKYKAEITNASVGATKNGKGTMVNLTWTIAEGEYENRLVFQSILTQHESEQAQKIGRQKFKDVCSACGITEPVTDLDVLRWKPCSIYVTVEKDKDGAYPDKNKVARVSPVIASWNGDATARKGASGKPGATDPNDDLPF
jgi:hypothetical protein